MKRLHAKSSLIGLLLSTMLFGGAFLVPNFALAANTFTPTTIPSGDTIINVTTDTNPSGDSPWYMFYPDGSFLGAISAITNDTADNNLDTSVHGNYTLLEMDTSYFAANPDDLCNTNTTLANCTGSGAVVGAPLIVCMIDGCSPPPSGGGGYHFGSGGIPPAYTVSFTTTTQQAAAVGAIGDISSFLWGYLPTLIELMVCIIVLGLGITLIYTVARREGYDERVDMENDFILAESKRKGPGAL